MYPLSSSISLIWSVSIVRPCTSSDSRTASSTCPCRALRFVMISVTVSWPTIERTEPLSTSSVELSIWSCWLRKRCAAARTIDSDPPTLTTATAFTRIVMASRVCAVACTLSWRLRRLSLKYASTIGLTNTRDPKTTRCPAFSVSAAPRAVLCRDVTMIASSGLATLMPRNTTMTTMSTIRMTTAQITRLVSGSMAKGSMPQD